MATLDLPVRVEQVEPQHVEDLVGSPSGGPTADSKAVGRETRETDVKSTVPGAVANFVNSIIGAGIIGLPYALQEAGLGAGLVLLLAIAAMTVYSVQAIVRLGVSVGKRDYEALCEHAFGPAGFYAITVAMFLFAVGAMIGYLVILGDTAAAVFAHWAGSDRPSPWTRRAILSLLACVLLLPLCLVRNMSNLARTSATSLGAVVWIVCVVCARSVGGAPGAPLPQGPDTTIPVVSQHVFPAIGVIAFAFVCHHNSFIVFNSLKESSTAAWQTTSRWSVGISVVSCTILALAGYLQFRGITKGNVLNNYDMGDEVVNFTRLLYAVTMVFTYPMEIFVARHCITVVWQRFGGRSSGNLLNIPPTSGTPAVVDDGASSTTDLLDDDTVVLMVPSSAPLSTVQHVGLSLVLFTGTLIVALATTDLGFVLEITGGVSATVLGFIMPSALCFRLSTVRARFWEHEVSVWAGLQAAAAPLALGVFGVVAFFCSTILTVIKASK